MNNFNYILQINAFWEKIETEAGLKPTSVIVYLALLQINNRCGWKEKFKATYGMVLNMTGIANDKTYYSALKELLEKGYIIYDKGPNQYQAASFTIKMLYQNLEEQGRSKVEAMEEQLPEQGRSKGDIPKQENYKQTNYKTINDAFEEFWNLYDKKVGLKEKILKKWNTFSINDHQAIMDYIPEYKIYQPDKKFRKDPLTFLNNKAWLDEIVSQPSHMGKFEKLRQAYIEIKNPYD